jgi:hypothetical protein
MASTYEPIATTTLGSAASSITFSSISSAYTDLRVVLVGKSSTGDLTIAYRFNSDTGSNYSYTSLYGNGTSALSNRGSNNSYAFPVSNSDLVSSQPQMLTIDVFSYAGSTNKTALATFSQDLNGSGSVYRTVNLWRSVSAITSISLLVLSNDFAIGTTATLYGILKA